MPLDVSYPDNLLEDIFTDSQPVCVILNEATKDKLPGVFKGNLLRKQGWMLNGIIPLFLENTVVVVVVYPTPSEG